LLLGLLGAIPVTREATIRFATENWSGIASVWGLWVSFYVYIVAKSARKAALDAVSAEKLQTALAGLKDAAAKCTDVGQFADARKWDVARLRAEEVMTCCRTTLAAWGENEALTESRRKLNEVATLMRSIIEESHSANVNETTIRKAQLDSREKLSVVVGNIQKDHKSGSL
jgi:hypothetical protein